MKPLALDLCCGKGGWAKGLIAADWDVVGVDIDERFRADFPGWFICANVVSLAAEWHVSIYEVAKVFGIDIEARVFRLVVASPSCEQYTRHMMPWTRRKNPPEPDLAVWLACEQIAASLGVPLVIENVREAQRWHGTARWHFGSQYLWGDIPALMPKHPGWNVVRQKQSRTSGARAERAMVPFDLALHIGRVFHPGEEQRRAS
jgi:site-specific DNA-cytosine methylase